MTESEMAAGTAHPVLQTDSALAKSAVPVWAWIGGVIGVLLILLYLFR